MESMAHPRDMTIRVAHQWMMGGVLPSLDDLSAFCSDGECYEYAEAVARNFKRLKLRKDTGAYIRKGKLLDHAWVVAPDGTIIDTTHDQLDRRVPILIAKPGTKEHARYLSSDDMTPEQLEQTYGPA